MWPEVSQKKNSFNTAVTEEQSQVPLRLAPTTQAKKQTTNAICQLLPLKIT